MNALKQYIDLFTQHSDLVDGNSAHTLNALRRDALESLKSMSLPAPGSENYETTDLNAMLAPDYGINIARVNIDANPGAAFHCGVPNISTSLFFNVNDIFAETEKSHDGLPEGIYVGSLRRFSIDHPEISKKYYGCCADLKNPIVALDTLFAQDGIVVWVKEGVKVEKPIQIVNILQNGMPLMAVRRLLVIVEDNAEVTLLSCDHTQNPDVDFLALQTIEIIAGANSRIDYYDLEESSEKTSRLSALYLKQREGSNVLIDGMTLYNGNTRNEFHCEFEGENAFLKLLGMGIEDKDRHLDNYTRVEHLRKGCHTDELFKYVLDDEATGAFTGLIHVVKGADKTEAYQSNRNIVGSDKARMFSKPQLEIYDDDVKCSHGTAIGQLDEMQVFYMRTRGIPEATAKLLLKQAFMADVIDGIRMKGLKERLQLLVERRFAGYTLNCSSCHSACAQEEGE
ncbi:MAG: Fe-S cluster assembly protein SufD [Muribaculaceae bacterium]|nr:Fe-S cluster assembly protein SufD [Muribaculaceae bacterium]MDE6754855.1 Fe-S cluster assembly protein SufD [Muribaculaceae bacterium]